MCINMGGFNKELIYNGILNIRRVGITGTIIFNMCFYFQKEKLESGGRGLLSSKDRAQMTANTALSLSQIVVLKQLIDGGPGENKYYWGSLCLILFSLSLQVIQVNLLLYE